MKILDTYPNLCKLNCKGRKNSSIIYLGRIEILKIYCRHPFDTSSKVRILLGCVPEHIGGGAKDLAFDGIRWGEFVPGVGFMHGTPVYAMESGIVRKVRKNLPNCPDPNNCPQFDNMVLVEGSDRFYTQYGHITPDGPIQEGKSIQKGELLGFVDNSGVTTTPHVHVARYEPGNADTWFDRPTCDWYIHRVDSHFMIPPGTCRSHYDDPNCPGYANNVVVQGSDGFYTEYAHITPGRTPYHGPPSYTLPWIYYYYPLDKRHLIRAGDLLGWMDNSGYAVEDPSIHYGRYTPGDPNTLYLRPSLCDWYIHRVDSPFMHLLGTCRFN
jgi:hypothetical protein